MSGKESVIKELELAVRSRMQERRLRFTSAQNSILLKLTLCNCKGELSQIDNKYKEIYCVWKILRIIMYK